jgi:hypothetical protein
LLRRLREGDAVTFQQVLVIFIGGMALFFLLSALSGPRE